MNRKKRNEYKLLAAKLEGKRPLGRTRRRWICNIKTDPREIVWGALSYIGLSQERDKWRAVVNAVMKLQVYKILGNCRVATQLVASRTVLSYE
jgi:hypothetical protein